MNFNIVNTLITVCSEYLSISAIFTYIQHWISIGNFMIYIYMNTLTTLILQASVSMPLSSTVHSHVHTSRFPPVHSTVRHMSAFGTCAILHSHTLTRRHSLTHTHTHTENELLSLAWLRPNMNVRSEYICTRTCVYMSIFACVNMWMCECVSLCECESFVAAAIQDFWSI